MKFYTKPSGRPKGGLYKFLLIMRLITILILAGMMQVSAGTYGQKLTLNQKGITLRQVFKEIKRQTGYDVLWQKEKLNGDQVIDAHFNATPIAEVMVTCLNKQNLDFKMQDESIIVRAKDVPITLTDLISRQDSIVYKGTITDENGKAMAGATVRVKDSRKVTYTTPKGTFAIYGPKKGGSLLVSYIGYLTKEITLSGVDPNQVGVKMVPGSNNLGEVNVVSTGYQDLPKERATGSFEVITKEQLQHSTDPNLLRRLEGITTSMNFNNQLSATNSSDNVSTNAPSPLVNLTIRGKTTLPSAINGETGVPLVIIDGIASPYSIDFVNPNEVESITILKDAAAASIWGSRAANGVIVVKTKRGNFEKPVSVSFNTNTNITNKFDIFYNKMMSVSDFIDAQAIRFRQNNINVTNPTVATLRLPQKRISPVDEILSKQKRGETTQSQTDAALDALRGNDIRRDYSEYFLRNSLRQSYSIGVDGGSKYVAYRLAGSYDKISNNTKKSTGDRIVLSYTTSIRPLKKLELQTTINYSLQHTNNQAPNNKITGVTNEVFYPYSELVDDAGNPLSLARIYRPAWVDLFQSTYGNKVLNLNYVPLEDINEGYAKTSSQNINLGISARYNINSIFSANVAYNYNKGRDQGNTLYRQNSFYMRDLINLFTSPTTFVRNLPLGGLLRTYMGDPQNQTLRGQLNINKIWNEKHVLSGISGIDISKYFSTTTANDYYGYDEEFLSNNNYLPFNTFFSTLYTNSIGAVSSKLPVLPNAFTSIQSRTISEYANAAYTYDRKYSISGSLRKDASSDFGMGSNKGGTPFWSTGLSWNISNEGFYHLNLLPKLQLRTTYGYNGNVNPAVSAYPIIFYSQIPGGNGLYYAGTQADATNLRLRPEKTGILNLGLDFGFRNNRISGSLEYYDKRTKDLLSPAPVDPTTGYSQQTLNIGSIHGWGMDLNLSSINLQYGRFSWSSNFLLSYNRVKVSKLFIANATSAGQVLLSSSYREGYDLSSMFAFKWAGLNPITGDPRGIVDGHVVDISSSAAGNNALTEIRNAPVSSLRFFGSAVPTYYGSLRNTISYGELSMSFNILYKLGYYFRKQNPLNYSLLFGNTPSLQREEYSRRWQKPGDELLTNVPSLTFPVSSLRDDFYALSEINVLRGDHLRLQEINFSYGLHSQKSLLKNLRIYLNMNNFGVIWRANKLGIDPDTYDYPNPRTYSFGLSGNF
ncbi:TonB-linked outer membrane protein, SusC/RagA family [Pedobacter westerhofensis]|uniref:TonB-linked outer membrane protein, SusC/RagA family n=1 Tax=Pedobacter westerhofensis TaxID=425512 RepID=A0A521FRV4_9SPHI|nr:SusC/RagA family TonB-linked outer membrane protein [Pedobacter westerhofensis]SMO98859.1 TonB-linked outer membrane protein, SusC/RagA family [Pedobacter westerhofensis]